MAIGHTGWHPTCGYNCRQPHGAAGAWPSTAFLSVAEFESLLEDPNSGSPLPRCPPITTQFIAYGSWPAMSAAFQANTRIVRLQPTGVCAVDAGGPDPIASAEHGMRMVGGAVEYFGVDPGDWLSVIAMT